MVASNASTSFVSLDISNSINPRVASHRIPSQAELQLCALYKVVGAPRTRISIRARARNCFPHDDVSRSSPIAAQSERNRHIKRPQAYVARAGVNTVALELVLSSSMKHFRNAACRCNLTTGKHPQCKHLRTQIKQFLLFFGRRTRYLTKCEQARK